MKTGQIVIVENIKAAYLGQFYVSNIINGVKGWEEMRISQYKRIYIYLNLDESLPFEDRIFESRESIEYLGEKMDVSSVLRDIQKKGPYLYIHKEKNYEVLPPIFMPLKSKTEQVVFHLSAGVLSLREGNKTIYLDARDEIIFENFIDSPVFVDDEVTNKSFLRFSASEEDIKKAIKLKALYETEKPVRGVLKILRGDD